MIPVRIFFQEFVLLHVPIIQIIQEVQYGPVFTANREIAPPENILFRQLIKDDLPLGFIAQFPVMPYLHIGKDRQFFLIRAVFINKNGEPLVRTQDP